MRRLGLVLVAALAASFAIAQQRPPMSTPALGLGAKLPQPADLLRPFDTPLPLLLKTAADPQRIEAVHCADWLKHRAAAVGSDNDAAWRVVRFQTVPCEAIAVLGQARPAAQSAWPNAPEPTTAVYPGALWPAPSAEAQRRQSAPGMTLARASGLARWTTTTDGTLTLSNNRWRVNLTLLARGDFDGDGWEDAAYRWQAEALQGSYADSRLVLLTRRAGQAGYTLMDAEPLLRAAAGK